MQGSPGKIPPNSEARQILKVLGPYHGSPGTLVVVALPVDSLEFTRQTPAPTRGIAIYDGSTPTGWSFIAIDALRIDTNQERTGRTTAHEIGHHTIRGIIGDHQRGSSDLPFFSLMTKGSNVQVEMNIRTRPKRLSSVDLYDLLNSRSHNDPLVWTLNIKNRFLIAP